MPSSITRSRLRLIAAVAFALVAGGCVASSPPSLEPTFLPGTSALPTAGPQVSPAEGTAHAAASATDSAVDGPSAEVRWSRVTAPFGDPPDATRIDSVVESRSGLVAAGRVKAPGRNQFNELATVFLSETGETWRTVPIDAGVGPEDTSEIGLLAAGPRGIVLFGDTCCAVEAQAIWYSSDGQAWERVPLDPSVFKGAEIVAARATADGFVAVGSDSGRAAIWTSNDGRTWTSVGGALAELGGGAIADVAPVDGRWRAVGSQDDGNTYDGALWESPDGVVWRRLPTDGLFQGDLETVLGRLYPATGGVLMIGNEGSHAERVQCEQSGADCGWGLETHWWSRDGRSWERLPAVRPQPGEPPLTGAGPNEFRLIATDGKRLFNLGEDRLGVVRLWLSVDGRDWQQQGRTEILRSGQDMASGIAVIDGRIIAVGDAWDGSASKPGEPAVWIGQLPGALTR